MKLKTASTNDLKIKAGKILEDTQNGSKYEILRYSRPLGVLLSYKEYQNMLKMVETYKKELCKLCRSKCECIVKKIER